MKYICKVFDNGDLIFQVITSSFDDIIRCADHYCDKTVKVSLLDEEEK